MTLLQLLACRPDPGAPDYPEREPWIIEDDGFYTDALDPGEERLSLGIFYEGVSTESYVIDGVDNHFYVYEGTFTVETTDDRWEGYSADIVTHGALAWFGGGVHWDVARDLSGWDALHLVVQTSDDTSWQIGVTGGGTESRVSVADYGLVPDEEWHELVVPLEDFAGADLTAVTVALLLVGESGAAGDSFVIDGVYYTRGGT